MGDRFQAGFQLRVTLHLFALLNGRRLTLDVGQDGSNFWHLLPNFFFEGSHLVVGIFERQTLVHFEMLLNVQAPIQILNADIVHIDVVAGGNAAHTVENVFSRRGPRNRMDDNICVG